MCVYSLIINESNGTSSEEVEHKERKTESVLFRL